MESKYSFLYELEVKKYSNPCTVSYRTTIKFKRTIDNATGKCHTYVEKDEEKQTNRALEVLSQQDSTARSFLGGNGKRVTVNGLQRIYRLCRATGDVMKILLSDEVKSAGDLTVSCHRLHIVCDICFFQVARYRRRTFPFSFINEELNNSIQGDLVKLYS